MTKLDELKALMEKATSGPWFSQEKYLGIPRGTPNHTINHMINVSFGTDDIAAHANANLIALSVNALPDLIAAVEALKEIDDTLSGSLPITQQCKAIARAALAKLGE